MASDVASDVCAISETIRFFSLYSDRSAWCLTLPWKAWLGITGQCRTSSRKSIIQQRPRKIIKCVRQPRLFSIRRYCSENFSVALIYDYVIKNILHIVLIITSIIFLRIYFFTYIFLFLFMFLHIILCQLLFWYFFSPFFSSYFFILCIVNYYFNYIYLYISSHSSYFIHVLYT